MERSLLDTDTFSEILRARDVTIRSNADKYLSIFGHFTFSVVTVAELIDGFRRQQLDSHIQKLLAELEGEFHEIIPLHLDAAKLAGYIFGDLHRSGRPIGRADPFIAAIAIQANTPLVTGNTKHFERIQALGYPLRLANWREPTA